MSALASEGFWRENFPGLSIDATPFDRIWATPGDAPEPSDTPRMAEDGYFQGRSGALAGLAPRLADAVRTAVRLDVPPAFLFLFDEAWAAFAAIAPRLTPFLDDLRILPDFWVWHVAPGDSGWAPHVDKGGHALGPDGRPLSLTAWLPLSRAIPLNSCIYVLPAGVDPEYGLAPNQRSRPVRMPLVRALPAEPGDLLVWNQAVLHWGSASSRFAEEPRISMALEFQRADVPAFNQPLIDPAQEFGFETRQRLVAKQILQYRHMYAVRPDVEALATGLLG